LATLVHEQLLPPLPRPDAWGIAAELQGIAACYVAAGVATSFEELMVVTGTAFRAHVFSIKLNPGLRLRPDPEQPNAMWSARYLWSSLQHNNYGHTEATAYYLGGEVRDAVGMDVLEFWKVVRFEVDAGRPLVLYGGRAAHRADLIVGYRLERDPMRQVIYLQGDGEVIPLELPAPTLQVSKGAPAARVIADGAITLPRPESDRPQRPPMPGEQLFLVRPGPLQAYRSSDAERIRDVLRWAVEHGHHRKELIYETSRFYATGLQAFEAWASFLTEGIEEELASPTSDADDPVADLALHTAITAQEWSRARRVAATWLRAHAGEALPTAVTRPTADAYDRVADALEYVRGIFAPVDDAPEAARAAVRSRELRAHAATKIRKAAEAEHEALALLTAGLTDAPETGG